MAGYESLSCSPLRILFFCPVLITMMTISPGDILLASPNTNNSVVPPDSPSPNSTIQALLILPLHSTLQQINPMHHHFLKFWQHTASFQRSWPKPPNWSTQGLFLASVLSCSSFENDIPFAIIGQAPPIIIRQIFSTIDFNITLFQLSQNGHQAFVHKYRNLGHWLVLPSFIPSSYTEYQGQHLKRIFSMPPPLPRLARQWYSFLVMFDPSNLSKYRDFYSQHQNTYLATCFFFMPQ